MTTGSGYICLSCEVSTTKVLDSRQGEDGFIVRRRECLTCGFRFGTVEVPVDKPRTKTEYEQFRLARRRIFPALMQLADEIDLLRAEHD